MDFKTFVISIVVIGVAEGKKVQESNISLPYDIELVPRDIGDYVTSWFWSSKNTEKENTVNTDPDENKEKINPVQEIPKDAQPENVQKIIDELKEDVENTDNEKKNKTLDLWKSMTKTVSETTSPYIEVMYKNSRRFIDIGAYGTSKRSRCFTEMMNPLSGILGLLLSLLGLGARPGNNAGLTQFLGLGMPPNAVSSSLSNANAGALSLAGLGGANPGSGVQFVSLQDYAKLLRNAQQAPQAPNLGGNQNIISELSRLGITDISKLGGGSQAQPNVPSTDPNNLILMALLMRLLGDGNNGSSRKGIDTNGIDLSRLSTGTTGNDNSGLLTLIRQLINRPDADGNGNNSKVFIFRSNDLDDSDRNPIEMINTRGTPEERFKAVAKKFMNNPDLREKIVIVDEINSLLNDPKIKLTPELRKLINEFETKIRSDDDFEEVWKIAELTSDGMKSPRKFRNIRFIDDTGDKFTSFSDEDSEKLWKELVGSLTTKYKTRNINDPKTLKNFLKDLNLKSFED